MSSMRESAADSEINRAVYDFIRNSEGVTDQPCVHVRRALAKSGFIVIDVSGDKYLNPVKEFGGNDGS